VKIIFGAALALHLDSVVIVDVNTLNKLKTKTDGVKR